MTVTTPNGTNASICGAALTSISVDSLAKVDLVCIANLPSSDKLIGENLSLGPEDAKFSPDMQVRFNYTDSQIRPLGIAESDLTVKFCNTATNAWEVTGDVKLVKWDGSRWVRLETTEKNKDAVFTYYEAKTDAFSVFAITGLKTVVEVPTAVPTLSEVTPTKTAIPEVTEKPTPGFEAILAIFATALSVTLLIKGRKRR